MNSASPSSASGCWSSCGSSSSASSASCAATSTAPASSAASPRKPAPKRAPANRRRPSPRRRPGSASGSRHCGAPQPLVVTGGAARRHAACRCASRHGHRPQPGVRPRPRRRLRLRPACPDHPPRGRLVRRGSRLHQRHLHGHGAADRARSASRPAQLRIGRTVIELRQGSDDGLRPPLRRPLRHRPGPLREPGLGLCGTAPARVADGMGGHAGGDVASSSRSASSPTSTARRSAAPRPGSPARADRSGQPRARRDGQGQPDAGRHGHDRHALLRSGDRLVLAHIGDSRAFLLRDGELTQVTKDHTFVQSLVDEGRITEEEADDTPSVPRHAGARRSGRRRARPRCARPAPATVAAVLRRAERLRRPTRSPTSRRGRARPAATADRLVQLALRAGAPDNMTVIVGDVVDAGLRARLTTPQVVGAAAAPHRSRHPPDPGDAAARPPRSPAEADRRRRLTTSHPRRGGRPARPAGPRGLAVVLRRGDRRSVAARSRLAWTQRQYFVGPHDGKVAVSRGSPRTSARSGCRTSSRSAGHLARSTCPTSTAAKVEATSPPTSLADAENIVEQTAHRGQPVPVTKADPAAPAAPGRRRRRRTHDTTASTTTGRRASPAVPTDAAGHGSTTGR